MPTPIFITDAFTCGAFSGNPAAVCRLTDEVSDVWMQQVAAEMNLSETAFLRRTGDSFSLRWFTPTAEVALCGHATLASAHVLWSSGALAPEQPALFDTLSGRLTAVRSGEWIVLNFPALSLEPATAPAGLLEAVRLSPDAGYRSQFDMLLVLRDEDAVRAVRPDFNALKKVAAIRGVIVTARSSNPEWDFVSRFFAPAVGVDEDPVTGSAHCALAPYWATVLGKSAMTAYQASSRGGLLRLKVVQDRVELAGKAVTVLEGALL